MTVAEMTSRERIAAALNGSEVDHPPVSVWRHFPEEDQTAEGLTAATLRWQAHFKFDVVKFMPSGDYPTIDWGGISRYQGTPGGTRTTTTFPIRSIEDWSRLSPLDVERGFNRTMLDAVSLTRAQLDPNVPLLQTIFGPLTIAMKLSNGMALQHFQESPTIAADALRTITSVTKSMLRRSIDYGADGVFFATQCADTTVMPEAEYRSLALSADLEVLSALREETILMVHLHGSKPMLSLLPDFPPGFVNWHDRRFGPDLEHVRRSYDRPVAGGIDEVAVTSMDENAAADQATTAIRSTKARSMMVTPGCVVPVATPEITVGAIVEAVRREDVV